MISEQEYAEEVIESVLADLGLEAARREKAWVVGAAGAELLVRRTEDGASVRATLVDLDGATPECREAVTEFLRRAGAGVKLATATVDDHTASVEAVAGGDEFDVELARAIQATARVGRLLAHEAKALVQPELARVYLEHCASIVSAGPRGSAFTSEGGIR
jgi:hypothetical protein